MNKIFKVIWNHASQSWVAVSELQRAKGKTKSLSTALTVVASALLLASETQAATVVNPTSGNTVTNSDGTVAYAIQSTATNSKQSIIIGNEVKVEGEDAAQARDKKGRNIAIGIETWAKGGRATAVGSDARAHFFQSSAIGAGANASGRNAQALGVNTRALANFSVAAGINSISSQESAVSVGAGANATGLRSLSVGYKTEAKAENSTAIGQAAVATKLESIAIGKNAKSDSALGIAIGSNASTKRENYAVPPGARDPADKIYGDLNAGNATAIGSDAFASGEGAVAIGHKNEAKGLSSVALGRYVKSNHRNTIGIGFNSSSVGDSSLAIGTKANASGDYTLAMGDRAVASGYSGIGLGAEAKAVGDFTLSIGNGAEAHSEGAVVLGANANATEKAEKSVVIGVSATAHSDSSVAIGRAAYVAKDSANTIALGYDSNALAVEALSIGSKTKVESKAAIALGSNINIAKGFDESVALGTNSTVRAATKEDTATVNGFTYSGFRGEENLENGRVVSMGNGTHARQVINVAPGKIASDSTDAINGSQLYLLADTLGNIAKATAAHLGGGAAVTNNNISAPTYKIFTGLETGGNSQTAFGQPATNVGAAFTNLNSYVNQGFKVSDNAGTVQGVVTPGNTIQFIDGKNTKAKVVKESNGVTKITFDVETTAGSAPNIETVGLTVNDGKVTLPQQADEAKLVNAKDIANAINNSAWKVGRLGDQTGFTFNETNTGDVKAGDEFRVADGNFTKVTVGTKQEGDKTISAVKVDVDAQKVVEAAQRPVVYTDNQGNKVVKSGNKFVKLDPQGLPTTGEVEPENVIASLNDGSNKTDTPMTLANVKSTLPGTKDNPGDPAASQDNRELPDFSNDNAKKRQHAATIDDVLNAGFNVRGAKTAEGAVEDVDFVTPYDTLEFDDGNATDMVVTNEDNKTTKIKVDIRTDDTTIKVSDDKKLMAVTSVINSRDNKPAGEVNAFTPVTATALVTANTVAEVANKILAEGLDFTGNDTDNVIHRDLGTKLTIKGEKADATDTSGKNLYVATDTGTNALLIKFSDKPEFKEMTLSDEDKAPVTLSITGAENAPAELTLNSGDAKAPVAIKNVSAGAKVLDGTHRGDKATADTSTKFDADPARLQPKLSTAYTGLADLNGSEATNVFTVADAKNLGWVVSATGNDYADKVSNANEVRFIGKNAAKVTGETDANGVRTITVDVEALAGQQPVVYTDAQGNKLKKAADGNFYPEDVEFDDAGNPKDQATAESKKVAPEDVIASLNNGQDKTDTPMALANVKGNLNRVDKEGNVTDPAGNPLITPNAKDLTKAPDLPTIFDENQPGYDAKVLNNAATIGDVFNAGWNLQGNGKAKDFVKPFDTVNFADGVGTSVDIQASDDGKVNTIKVNTVTAYTDADGTILKKGTDGKYYKPDQLEANGDPKLNETAVENPQVNVINVDGTATTPTVLGNVAQGANTIADKEADGKPLVNVGGKLYAQDQFVDGKLKADAVEAQGATDVTTPVDKAKAGLADLANSTPTNVMTVADAKNLGWVISADKEDGKDTPYAADVRTASEVKFTGKNGVEVVGSTKDGVREIAISMKEGEVVPSNEFKDPAGKVLVKVDDQYYNKDDIDPTTGKPKDNTAPVVLTPEQEAALVNNGKHFVTGNKVADAIQKSGWNVGLADITAATDAFANPDNQLAADKLEKVNPNDNLRFTNGKGTTAKLATVKKVDADGTVVTDTFMKFDVDLPITYRAEDDNGNPLVKANDGKWYKPNELNPDGTLKDPATAETQPKAGSIGAKLTDNNPDTKDYDVKDPISLGMAKFIKDNPNATPEEIAAERDKLVKANPDAKDTLVKGEGGVNLNNVAWAEKPDQAVNKDQLDQTVGKSGFVVKQNGQSTLEANANATEDDKSEKVTPNDVVDFVNGINTQVNVKTEREAGRDVTKVRVDVAGLPVTYTDKDGNKVAKAPDGSYYKVDPATGLPKVQPDGTPDPAAKVENGDVIASMVNPEGDSTTTPTALTNVAQGANTIADKEADGKPLVNVGGKLYAQDQFVDGKLKADAVEAQGATDVTTPVDKAKAGLADLANSTPTNVMTVADAKNLGWVISADKEDGKDTPYVADVRTASEVKFTGKNGVEVVGSTKDGVREIAISMKEGEVVPSNEFKDPTGKVLVKVDDQYYNKDDIDPTTGKPKDNTAPVQLTPEQEAALVNNGKHFVTGNKVADAIQKSGWNVGLADITAATDAFANPDNQLAADKLEKVNPNDNLRFTNGKGTTAKLATVKKVDADGTVVTDTFMKFDVDLPITYRAEDDNGNPLVKANNGKWYQPDQVNPDGTLKDPATAETQPKAGSIGAKLTDNNPDTKDYDVKDPISLGMAKFIKDNPNATPEEIAAERDKLVTANPDAKDTLVKGEGGVNLNNVAWAEKPDQAVNKDQLDQTVGKSGFVVKQNGQSTLEANANATEDDKSEKVTPNDVVDFVNGINTQVNVKTEREAGRDVTKVRVDVAGLPVTYTDKDGNKVAKAPDGSYYKVDPATGLPKVQPDGTPDPAAKVENGDVIASMVNPEGDSTTTPTALTNVAQGAGTLDGAKDDKGNPLVNVEGKYYSRDQFDPATGKLKAGEEDNDVTPATAANPDSPFNGLASLENAKPSNVMTVADAKNLGWVISADKQEGKDEPYSDDVRNASEVKFTGGAGIEVTGKTTDNIREINISLKKGEVMPTDAKDKEGNILVKVGDDYFKAEDIDTNGKPKPNATKVNPDDVVKADNAGEGFVTGNQVGDAIRGSGFVVGKATDVPAADKFENKDERVNPNDELRYADGKNTHVKLATVEKVDASGTAMTVTTVKVDSDLPIDFKFTDAKGKEYAKANDGKFYEKEAVNPDGSLKDPASNPTALEPAEVAKLKKGAQLTNGVNNDGVANKPYEAKDPIQLAVQKAVVETLTANPDATPEEIASAVATAKAEAIKAEPAAKDTIKAGDGGVSLDNVAWAEKPDQAVNKDQLDQTVNKSGFYVKQNGKSTLADNADATEDAKTEKVTPNDVVNFVNGGNLLAKAETKRDEATGQDITEVSYSVTGLPIAYTTKEGTPVVKVGDKFFKVNKDGYPVGDAVPAEELATQLVNPTATPDQIGKPSVLANVASGTNTIADKVGDDGKALVQVGEGPDAKFYTADQFVDGVLKPDANAVAAPTAATKPVDKAKAGLADLKNSNAKNALSVADAKKLGFVISAGDYAADVRTADVVEFASGNDLAEVRGITRADGVREIKVTVSKDPAFNSVKVGGNDGPKISATPEGDLMLTKKDGSPVRITNVAKGVDPNDAVNVGQLHDEVGKALDGAVLQKFGDLNGRLNKVDKNMRAGIAGANAATGLPQVYLPGKSMLAASAGTFKGESAIAVGYSRASDNGKVILKLQGNGNTRGDVGGSVGIGYQW
ncbi:YadA-like family protein [Pasteurella sp. PK-2025]|uniref:YadA-like family protein n=1 Tax=Pasteurella sp. PK-2025 TaxID=3413133 RepID=UPI003C74A79E